MKKQEKFVKKQEKFDILSKYTIFRSEMPVCFFKNPWNFTKKILEKIVFTHNVIYNKKMGNYLVIYWSLLGIRVVITWYLTSNYLAFYQ